jgi:PAS domain S-box-containing protein
MTTKMLPDRTFQTFMRDMTERRLAELNLRESEARSRSYIENAPYGVFIVNEKGQFLRVNSAGSNISGYSTDELLTMSIPDLLHLNSSEAVKKYSHQLADTGQASGEFLCRKKDGSLKHWSIDTVKLTPTRFIGFVMDVTERKQAAEALRISEEKYRLLIDNSHDIIYMLDKEGIFTFVSPAWTTLLGHPLNQVTGQSFQKFVHPDDLEGCLNFMKSVFISGQRQEGVEYRVMDINGEWRWHTSSAVPLKDNNGEIAGFYGIARNITERKQAEEALRESEEKYRLIFEYSPVGLIYFDDRE